MLSIKPEEELAKMDEWCTTTHTGSGLVARVKASKVTEQEAIEQTIKFLRTWVPKGKSPICGNSVGQDRRFLIPTHATTRRIFSLSLYRRQHHQRTNASLGFTNIDWISLNREVTWHSMIYVSQSLN